jgi:hypothetical protein
MKVTKQLVSDLSNTYGSGNPCDYITIHETANTNNGADAEAHADLQSGGNSRDASWHYSVDDHSAYQSFGDDIQCWHAGDGQGNGNMKSIAIEICVNKDGNFDIAVENAASLTADLMDKHNIPIGNVVQHNKWSGKNCPTYLRNGSKGISWTDFINLVKAGGGGTTNPPKPPAGDIVVDGIWGTDTTYMLQKALGTPEDGEVWLQAVEWKDNNPGLTSGWKWESGSVAGSAVIREVQERLKAEGRYSGSIDGLIGPNTIKGLQKHFGTAVDGELWLHSPCIKAMQKKLNSLVTL